MRTGDAECVSLTLFDDAFGRPHGNEAARAWVAANPAHLNVPAPQLAAGEMAFSPPR